MTKFLFALTSLLFVSHAHAGSYNCDMKLTDGTPFVVAINFNEPPVNEPKVYHSVVTLAGKDVPMLGAACFFSDRPGTRYIKCAHQVGSTRIEVYPEVTTTSGALKLMQFIIWKGTTPTKGSFDNCSTSKN